MREFKFPFRFIYNLGYLLLFVIKSLKRKLAPFPQDLSKVETYISFLNVNVVEIDIYI